MKIKEILEYGKNNLIPKEDAYRLSKMLLKHLLKVNDSYLLINCQEDIDVKVEETFVKSIELLKAGIPIQYITNHQEFMRLDFYVDSNVLIPQPDTEILVEEVIDIAKSKRTWRRDIIYKSCGERSFNRTSIFGAPKTYKILDLCTGSGAIGIAIAKYIQNSEVIMSDISEKALDIAKKNALNNEVIEQCDFILSNMFENIEERFDIIVSNPPYIKTNVINTLEVEVINEPMLALDGGDDGLEFYRIIAQNAYKYLNEGGILALEIGYDQKEDVINLLNTVGKYTDICCKKDLSGNDRVIVCKNI